MKRWNRKDYKNISIFILFYLFLVLFFTRGKYYYGSNIDWQNQYWVFAEYFRNLFYQTHQLIPNFAFHLGGGQNIYNFSYYGLLNPIILISYLLPQIKMIDYIMYANIFIVIVTIILFYRWILEKGYENKVNFLITFIFECAGPLIYHSHKQIVFIDYFPFLIMGLIGIDIFIKEKKPLLLILSTFLMILTSYYYSVGGTLVFVCYATYCFLKKNDVFSKKKFLIFMTKICLSIGIGILMSSVLLLPTLAALLNGRTKSVHTSLFQISMFLPSFSATSVAYSSYSLGISAIALFAIIIGFFEKKRSIQFLSIILSILIFIPVSCYLLNGTLYLNTKAFIPFIPILTLSIAECFNQMCCNEQKLNKKIFFISAAISLIIAAIAVKNLINIVFLLDIAACIFIIYISKKWNKFWILAVFLICLSTVKCYVINSGDHLLTISDEKATFSSSNTNLINAILKKDKSFYRFMNDFNDTLTFNKIYQNNYYETGEYSSLENQGYSKLYYEVFHNSRNFSNNLVLNPTKNIFFNLYMGNKYFITNHSAPVGYQLVSSNDKESIYKNADVFPLGYVTDKLMNEKSFKKLRYPYQEEALLNYAIIKGSSKGSPSASAIEKLAVKNIVSDFQYENLNYAEDKKNYKVMVPNNGGSMNVRLNNRYNILMISFHMDEQSTTDDLSVTINGIKNTLTHKNSTYQNNNYNFCYTISASTPVEALNIVFSKGLYKISNLQVYGVNYNDISNLSKKVDPFILNRKNIKGDTLSGNITVSKNGYFVLNIPYDKGFSIRVDNKIRNYEKVNAAFIGFPIEKGTHSIMIKYEAPLRKEGMFLSAFGGIAMILITIWQYKNHSRK